MFNCNCLRTTSSTQHEQLLPADGAGSSFINKKGTTKGNKGIRKVSSPKEPSLNVSFLAKNGSYELKIIKQPEEQHRARYLTEGSRGTVKDRSQQSHPTVKVIN